MHKPGPTTSAAVNVLNPVLPKTKLPKVAPAGLLDLVSKRELLTLRVAALEAETAVLLNNNEHLKARVKELEEIELLKFRVNAFEVRGSRKVTSTTNSVILWNNF